MIKLVLLDDLILDAGTQIRTEINKEHVEDLAEAYREKRNVPPIDTFYDGGKYIVADGFHRVMGASKAGEKRIKATVHPGKLDKALLFAVGSNGTHGLRRTNADKRNAVMIAVHQWPKKTNEELSRICAVSRHLVDNIRPAKPITPKSLPSPGELFNQPTEVNRPNENQTSPPTDTPAPAPAPKDTGPAPAPVAAPAPAPAPALVQAELNGKYDDMGYPLTKYVVDLFNRKSEAEELVKKLQDVKNALKKVMDCGGDPLYAHLIISGFLPDLELSITALKAAIPYAVCPYCQGMNLEQCTNCRHTGLVSRWMFERQIPSEILRLRKIQIEKLEAKGKK